MRATNEYLCRPYSYYDMTGKLDFHPKFLTCVRSYSKSAFLSDLMAGVIVGIVALPLAIAFAIASGVSPEKGIITAVIAGFIVSFLGGSKVQIGGPTGAFIVIVYGVVQQYGLSGLAAATVMAGVLLILLGVFRLGTVIKFIPYPVVIGFTSGIAVTIFTTQMADVFGLTFGGETVPGDFIGKWMLYFRHFDTVNWWDAAVSLVSVAIIVIVPRIAKRVPGSLVAIVLVTVAVYIMKNSFGITGIDTIGDRFSIDSHLPKAEVPSLDWEAVKSLFPIAVTIAALGAIESLLSATVADGMISDHHNSNTELIALGIANMVTPVFGGIPATGAIARTMTNINNGGRTPVAGMIHAVVLLLIMLFLMPLAKYIPMACLACVLFMRRVMETTEITAVKNEIKVQDESGIHTYDEGLSIPKGVEVYEINGPYFFGVATQFEELMTEFRDRSKVRIIRMRKVPFIDSTGIHNLSNLCEMSRKNKITVVLSGVNPKVHSALQKSGFYHLLGEKNICPDINVALSRARQILEQNGQ